MVLTRKLLAAASLLVLAQQASGETLRDALVKAYETNPTLTGARAGQRATDESVTIAKANRLPGASANASLTENIETFPGSSPARRWGGTSRTGAQICAPAPGPTPPAGTPTGTAQ